jgi:anti-sigma-K factor RskA
MMMDRHAEIADRLEEYVLHQLPEPERRAVEDHLRVCATCAQDVDELRAVLEGVAEGVPTVTASAALRERVLAAAAAEPQEPVRLERRIGIVEQPRRPMWAMVPLAAAAVLVVTIAAVAFRIDQSRRELAGDLSRAQGVNAELLQRLQRFSDQTDLALSILTAGDTREIPLAGREDAAAAAARAYLSPTRGILVVADRLPPPPPGRIYQVWLIPAGQPPVSAGLLGEEPGGRGMLIVTPPRPGGGGGVTVAVTDEPPGGLSAPSGTMRLVGSI